MERFEAHPSRSGTSQAPLIGFAAGVTVGLSSWDIGFGVVSGLLMLTFWPCYYRLMGCTFYRRGGRWYRRMTNRS